MRSRRFSQTSRLFACLAIASASDGLGSRSGTPLLRTRAEPVDLTHEAGPDAELFASTFYPPVLPMLVR